MVNRSQRASRSARRSSVKASIEHRLLRLHCESRRPRFGRLTTLRRAFWRCFGVFLENFFVARFCDSESAKRDSRCRRFSFAIERVCARKFACFHEMPCFIGFRVHLTGCRLEFLQSARHGRSSSCAHRVDDAEQLRRLTHQHFLKRRSGFFISLVYSNCSASRIAGCTTLTSHLT
jgi:hypothetical protein